VRGGFFLKTEDNRVEWPGYASLLLQSKQGEQQLRVTNSFVSGGKLALQLAEINSRESVEALYNAHLFVARSLVKREAEEYLVADLIGCAVHVEGRAGVYGHVIAVHDFGAQENLEIQPLEAGRESILFPFTASFVLNLDEEAKVMTVKDEPAFLDEHKE
jgi:16S rRNA processing protein RimM